MPLIVQKEWYTKEQIEGNRDTWFVFGDNEDRKGTGGQAKYCRNQPNTIGIRTKRYPGTNEDAYWTDETFHDNIIKVWQDFKVVEKVLQQGGKVIFPADGFGTGLAKLSENAPETLKAIQAIYDVLVEIHGEK